MNEIIIHKDISSKVVMTGVYYKHNHPGGISAVIQYWSKYIDGLQYYPTFKEGSIITKLVVFIKSFIKLLYKLSTDKNVKILHAHTAAGTDFRRTAIIVNIAKHNGLKVALHSHASSFKDFYMDSNEKKKRWIREVLNKADILIVLSESWKAYFIGIGIPKEKIVILHNITAYPQVIEKKEDSKVRLLFMGEIGPRKGVFDLLTAIRNHKDELEGEIEVRIGGNKNEVQLLTAIKDYNIEKFVHFEGFVSGEKKIELLNWANVYVLPSFNEGLPISILEAMSYKMPIISTPVGGIPEVVDDSNGILVEPGNSEQIYKAILTYVHDARLIAKQGEESYKKVQTYMPDYVLKHLKAIYEHLLSH